LLRDAWTLAIGTLSWMQMRRLSESLAFERAVQQLNVRDADALRLAHLLIYETSKRMNFIDRFINLVLKPRNLGEFDLGVQAFLRLYVYQTRIAQAWGRVNVKEAESIAGLGRSILGWQKLLGVEDVLGLLLTTEKRNAFLEADDVEAVALASFHPVWFTKYCFRVFGRSQALALLEADNEARQTYVRLNTLKMGEDEIVAELRRESVHLVKEEGLKHVFRVESSTAPLAVVKGFGQGLFFVQDKASCFAALAADARPGMHVLDICAAPAAKTTFLGELMEDRGKIVSLDYSVRRLVTWRREVERMGVTIAEPVCCDVCEGLPVLEEEDVVVLDPPCTSTGAFGKMPSARWRLSASSVERMAGIQWRMIEACAGLVKVGGVLVYSTCSVMVEENELIVERFLRRHPEFTLARICPDVGVQGLRGLDECRRLFPHLHECNGFFVARLKRLF
jgi:16S rRNA (cytosine967-C5)-methyltransferase